MAGKTITNTRAGAEREDNSLADKAVTQPFNASADPARDPTPFEQMLYIYFGPEQSMQLVEKLNALQVPLPRNRHEFMSGQAGLMFFSNIHGVMIRIENPKSAYGNPVLANDSGTMLQPLAALKVGNISLEIMPGVHLETRDAESRKLYWKMWADGYHYWDERLDNAGRLPATPEFPDGEGVILDRLSVSLLTDAVAPVKRALQLIKWDKNTTQYRSPLTDPLTNLADVRAEFVQMAEELTGQAAPESIAALKRILPVDTGEAPKTSIPLKDLLRDALQKLTLEKAAAKKDGTYKGSIDGSLQDILYGDLRRAFKDAWPEGATAPDMDKMSAFWQQVRQAKDDGKLVAGWKEIDIEIAKTLHKTMDAIRASTGYEHAAEKIGKPYNASYAGIKSLTDDTSVSGFTRFLRKVKDFVTGF